VPELHIAKNIVLILAPDMPSGKLCAWRFNAPRSTDIAAPTWPASLSLKAPWRTDPHELVD
jgi:hypothetical protein